MLNEAALVGLAAVAPQFHQVNAAPRRIGFLSPQQIGRTRGQAEAAVDAVVEEIAPCRLMCVLTERDYIWTRCDYN